jgi:sterol 3beta-glucosyltransferase
MRVAILAHGTRGDVQPAVAVGDRLVQRGHEVAVAVNADLAGWVRRAGLEVVPSTLDVGGFLNSDRARRFLATGRFATLVREVTMDERRVNDSIVEACLACAEGADVVLSTVSMMYRGAVAAAAAQIPSGHLFYYPYPPTGRWASLATGVRDFRLPAMNRATFRVFNAMMWRQSRANIDDMCDAAGVPRFRRRPRVEDVPSATTCSPVLAARPDDWPRRHDVVGAVTLTPELRTRLGETPFPDDLRAWLDAGPPPVYFGFGSMPILDPRRLLAELAEITAARGLRGLIGAGMTDFGTPPEHLFVAGGVLDHDRLLPLCAAAVHHGGSGTTAAVLRAGLPSVVASVFFDQPFWGWRVSRAGAGVTLPFRSLTAARLGRALDRVLDDGCAARARALGMALRREDGAGRAAEAVERWANDRVAS